MRFVFDKYDASWALIDWHLFIVAMGLFLIGVSLAPAVYKKQIRWLMRYPLWIYLKLAAYVEKEHHFFKLSGLILILNSISVFFDLLSGWGVILVGFATILTGLNVSLVVIELDGPKAIYAMFLNPIAVLELPALWLSVSGGLKLGIAIVKYGYTTAAMKQFLIGLDIFLFFSFPLLTVAAILETTLIRYFQKEEKNMAQVED